MPHLPHKHSFIAAALCAWFVGLALVYATVTPPFEAPDEGSHFLYIHNLLETGELPVLEDRSVVFASQSVQRHHPPLYYLIGAALISWTERGDLNAFLERNPVGAIGFVSENNQNIYLHGYPATNGDTAAAIWVLRAYSIALSAGAVWFIYRTGRLVLGHARIGLFAAFLVVSMPSFVHIAASINNDNLVTLLFAAGVYLSARLWRRGLTRRAVIALGVVAGAIVLTKINGAALLAVIYGALALGAATGRFTWRSAAIAATGITLMTLAIGGWWYARNLALYGDPLALQATLHIWSRGGPPRLISLFELKGVWDSLWFTLGHLNIRGPEWFLSVYVPLLALSAVAGLLVLWRRKPGRRAAVMFLLAVGLLSFASLLAASSRINVSQGRILFPGLVALAPLVVAGLLTLWGRWGTGVLLLPLAAQAVLAPVAYLAPAFAAPAIVDAPPGSARRLEVTAGTLEFVAYELHTPVVGPKDTIRLTIYARGRHAENPLLFVKALHPLTQAVLGGADVYPGMMPTREMNPGVLYAIPVHFTLENAPEGLLRLSFALGWRVVDAEEPSEGYFLPMADANNTPLDALIVPGPTLVNPVGHVLEPDVRTDVVFGEIIRLTGIRVAPEAAAPGETLDIDLHWQGLRPIEDDWTLTVGLLNENGTLVAQSDEMPEGYPTSAWAVGPVFVESRRLTIPEDAPRGTYRLYVGWYRLADMERLPPRGENVEGSVYVYPKPIVVE